MWIVEQAKRIVSGKWFKASSVTASNVSAQAFVVTQATAVTATRPIGFAPDGYYLCDLGFFFSPGMSQDMGALFTQRQLNESKDFKDALVSGDLVAAWGVGTVPIADPATFVGSVTLSGPIQIANVANSTINPATEETLQAILALMTGNVVFNTVVQTIDSPTYLTFADVRSGLDVYEVGGFRKKSMALVNSGLTDVEVRGWSSLDGGVTYNIPTFTTRTLAPGGLILVDEEMAMTHFKFEVKRGLADGEVTTYGYAQNKA